jgi:hypothetical protein
MPQIVFWPYMGRSMVEQAHCVKVPDRPAKTRYATPFSTLACVT